MTDIVERIRDAENATHALFNHIFQDAREEIERLRAKVEQMERQEPAWFIDERGTPQKYDKNKAEVYKCGGLDLLYALPGAQGE